MENRVIHSIYVGEHRDEEAGEACKYLSRHLKRGMLPDRFSEIWEELVEDLESKEEWEETLEFEAEDLSDLYREAFKGGADGFVVFDNNAYIDIVAIRGKPLGREIALHVLGSEENVGDWTDQDTIDFLGSEYLDASRGK